MKHSKLSNVSDFGLNQFESSQLGHRQFVGVASPADVRPNLYGVD